MSLRGATVAVLAVLGSTLVAVPTAQAAPDPKLTITAVTLGRSAVAVSGLNTVAVPVRVKAGYDSADPQAQYLSLVVFLQRTGGTGQLTTMVTTDLERVAGPVQDGEWLGAVQVPSTADGTFKVASVRVGPFDRPNPADPTPFAGPSLVVTGVHQPRITAVVIPRVVPFGSGFTVRAAVTDSATGKPYGTRIPLTFLATAAWCRQLGPSSGILTDTAGIGQRSYEGTLGDVPNCVRLRNGPFDKLSLTLTPARPGILAATPAATSARVGTKVDVNGSVRGAPAGCGVTLQRLYGASQWRGVSTGTVRASGRFTVTAQPPYVGNVRYRVFFPTCGRFQSGISNVFTVRGI
ncbi:hypothetical protein [Kribbella sp. CA-293567]|uniref:hypothetical protein n=1 Tax=Kribbella sp. CA-293567 TaxID=3002436 RepID=UPI0022DDEFB6|nr:hypothetical protein [Kribbella sp. CA-293567]WBQ05399.1 hypothetical protein OX958_01045 [Kribbella sp. CA-293567]